MSKRYEEPIEVEAPVGPPEAFRWRGRRYRVRQVLCRWREAGGWWATCARSDKPWLAGDTREIVRLDATLGSSAGAYEIARDLRTGAWALLRVLD